MLGNASMENLENRAVVSGKDNVGGIAGELNCVAEYGKQIVQMYDSENTGAVSGKTDVGGIFGYAVTNGKNSLLMDCSSTSGVLMGYSEDITVQ